MCVAQSLELASIQFVMQKIHEKVLDKFYTAGNAANGTQVRQSFKLFITENIQSLRFSFISNVQLSL